jgi:hypothetical protein
MAPPTAVEASAAENVHLRCPLTVNAAHLLPQHLQTYEAPSSREQMACHCPEISSSDEQADGLHAHPQLTDDSRFSSVNSQAMRDITAIFNDAASSIKGKAKRKRSAGKRTLRALSKFFKTLFGKKKHKKARSPAMKEDLRLNLLSPKEEGRRVYDSDAREISTLPNTLTEQAGNVLDGRQNRRPGIKSYHWPAGDRLVLWSNSVANVPDKDRCRRMFWLDGPTTPLFAVLGRILPLSGVLSICRPCRLCLPPTVLGDGSTMSWRPFGYRQRRWLLWAIPTRKQRCSGTARTQIWTPDRNDRPSPASCLGSHPLSPTRTTSEER